MKTQFTLEELLDAEIPFKGKVSFISENCELTRKENIQLSLNIIRAVLPIFEEKYPKDESPRRFLEIRQEYINRATYDELGGTRYESVIASSDATEEDDAYHVAYGAAYAMAYSAVRNALSNHDNVDVRAYRIFQASHVCDAASYASDIVKNSNNPDYYNNELLNVLKNFLTNKMKNKLHQISLNFTKGEMEALLKRNGYNSRLEKITLEGTVFTVDGEEKEVKCWMKLNEDYEGPRTRSWWESQYKLESVFEKLFPKLLYNLLYGAN